MPEIIEIALPIDEIEARRERVEKAKRFATPDRVPVIPAKPGGLGEILASAPLLLERLATLTDRLTRLLSDENQNSISGILASSLNPLGEAPTSADRTCW